MGTLVDEYDLVRGRLLERDVFNLNGTDGSRKRMYSGVIKECGPERLSVTETLGDEDAVLSSEIAIEILYRDHRLAVRNPGEPATVNLASGAENRWSEIVGKLQPSVEGAEGQEPVI